MTTGQESVIIHTAGRGTVVTYRQLAEVSPVLSNMVRNSKPGSPLYLPEIRTYILEKVFEWCQHYHEGDSRQVTQADLAWDARYWALSGEVVKEIHAAAEFLNIGYFLLVTRERLGEMREFEVRGEMEYTFTADNIG